MSFLAPLFLLGLAAVAVPIYVHLIQRERNDVIEFPSLMFIQRIPYQSVERRRIHNWPLLLLRLAALALIVAAFARPFFTVDAIVSAASATGAREVVILLDRSASMAYGDHWTRAQDEAREIVAGLGGDDRATLVLFDRGAVAVPFERGHCRRTRDFHARAVERRGRDRVARTRRPAGNRIGVETGDFDRRNRRRAASQGERRCGEQGDGKRTRHARIMRQQLWLGNERDVCAPRPDAHR